MTYVIGICGVIWIVNRLLKTNKYSTKCFWGILIGITIVAFGTSAPEAAVSITSSLTGSNAMAVSNVIGSNLFNMLMVIGIAAVTTNVVGNMSTTINKNPDDFLVYFSDVLVDGIQDLSLVKNIKSRYM